MIRDLILKNRSYRRFDTSVSIELQTLRSLVDLARLSASVSNKQPLKYILSNDQQKNALIFPYLKWAGHLKDWAGPTETERPAAYIIILGDTKITDSFEVDHGIAAQSMLLGATELGLGGCMMGGMDKDGLRKALEIPDRYKILLVIVLGKPSEIVKLETLGSSGDFMYWRDEAGVHHVPKRPLDEIILG
jgi:nitroreductase